MRIGISTAYFGGAGGVERAVFSTSVALSGHEVVVFPRTHLGGELMDLPAHAKVASPRRYRPVLSAGGAVSRLVNRLGRSVQRRWNPALDILLHFGAETSARPYVRSRLSAVVAAGADLGRLNPEFDVLLVEAPVEDVPPLWHERVEVLPPPVFPIAEAGPAPADVPDAFLLTVMNPYGRVKGADVLRAVAPDLDMELVWCLSNSTIDIDIDGLDVPPNVRLVVNPSQSTLRTLYESCTAYVSFSRQEGFGWAIADALQYGAPIVSRRVGVLKVPGVDLAGVELYDDPTQIVDLIGQLPHTRHARDLQVLSVRSYRENLHRLLSCRA